MIDYIYIFIIPASFFFMDLRNGREKSQLAFLCVGSSVLLKNISARGLMSLFPWGVMDMQYIVKISQ